LLAVLKNIQFPDLWSIRLTGQVREGKLTLWLGSFKNTKKQPLLATTFDSLSEPTGCCHKSDGLCAVAQDITTSISATLLLKATK
jgi:hypothetical protein